VTDVKRSGFVA